MKIKQMFLTSSIVVTSGLCLALPVVALSCGGNDEKVAIVLNDPQSTVTDKSFNQSVYEGISKYLNGTTPAVYKPSEANSASFEQVYSNIPESSIIVAPGFAQIEPISHATHGEFINKRVILLDGEPTFNAENESLRSQIASVIFKPEQASFIAGYLLAKKINEDAEFMSKFDTADSGGKVRISTFGGIDLPTVTGYMSGFKSGINFYNEQNPLRTQAEWYEAANRNEHFTNSFSVGAAEATATKLISHGVDIILPVAGPEIEDVLKVYSDTHRKGFVIGVDSAQEDLYEQSDRILFSITKNLSLAVYNLLQVIDGGKTVAGYEGLGHTLTGDITNDLVTISDTPYSQVHFKASAEEILAQKTDAVYAAALQANTTFN